MRFSEELNRYILKLDCMAKELADAAGISAASMSRYRSGNRVPELDSVHFRRLCAAIARLAEERHMEGVTEQTVQKRFAACTDYAVEDQAHLGQNLNTLLRVLHMSIGRLCQNINYDASSISRFRNGSRQPPEPEQFAMAVATHTARYYGAPEQLGILSALLGVPQERLKDETERAYCIRDWLRRDHRAGESVEKFLEGLNSFHLEEYLKAVHFAEIKVPTVPFQLPGTRTYSGLKEMMEGELDFLKATVLSKSMEPVTMFSDMPMEEMAKDPEFPKKWMMGMAMMLKKGLHIRQIHNLDRSFEEMMLGLESWIPMYMTGQISPYYLPKVQNDVFLHFLRVSGAAAISGEAIAGSHEAGRYYFSKARDDVAYCQRRADALLEHAQSLMDIYRRENAGALQAFLMADVQLPGPRKSVLSTLPLYTMEPQTLERFLIGKSLPDADREKIIGAARAQREMILRVLAHSMVEDHVPGLDTREFERHPASLLLSGMFYEADILYDRETYREHLKQSRRFAEQHGNYRLVETSGNAFRNLQIYLRTGEWAMVSKGKAPAIHFVIHHPKLREALELFTPPLVEPR